MNIYSWWMCIHNHNKNRWIYIYIVNKYIQTYIDQYIRTCTYMHMYKYMDISVRVIMMIIGDERSRHDWYYRSHKRGSYHAKTQCSTLQYTAAQCNTLQHNTTIAFKNEEKTTQDIFQTQCNTIAVQNEGDMTRRLTWPGCCIRIVVAVTHT